MILFILLYISGFVSSYYMVRATFRKIEWDWLWSDVIFGLVVSVVCNWLAFVIALMVYCTHGKKIPRWL